MGREDNLSGENGESSHLTKPFKPLVRKSKLVVVDLAGSERIQKSGICPNLRPCFSTRDSYTDGYMQYFLLPVVCKSCTHVSLQIFVHLIPLITWFKMLS